MTMEVKRTISLNRPAVYQIKVPGHLDESWTEWDGQMTVKVAYPVEGSSITTLTGSVDQAALQGMLRRLYALGLPLISVICLDLEPAG